MTITCTQCETPAFVNYENQSLCVRHHLMVQQASWIQFAQSAAMINELKGQLSQVTGYILPLNYMQIPQPPSLGDSLTFNNIKVTDSSVGLINTGTIKRIEHLDASVTTFAARGKDELAEYLKHFTQVLFDSEIDQAAKAEVAEQLEYLVGQAQAEPSQRSTGIIKAVFGGVEQSIAKVTPLTKAWANLQPLLKDALQVFY